MDESKFRDFKVSRGFNYHYYFSAATNGRPTLLFVHTLMSCALDWHHQATYFESRGFGVVVPDLLGYGRTDKPEDARQYVFRLMAEDLVELLDHEKIQTAIPIGHSLGSILVSRLAVYFRDRFPGFAFLSVSYNPSPDMNYELLMSLSERLYGYSIVGCFRFFLEDDCEEIMSQHVNSYLSLFYPSDPEIWKVEFCPAGALRKWLLEDRRTELPSYLTKDDFATRVQRFVEGGFKGPNNWNKQYLLGYSAEDEAESLERDKLVLDKPAFVGLGRQDYLSPADMVKDMTESTCEDATIVEYECCHWVMLDAPEKFNADIHAWIETLDLN